MQTIEVSRRLAIWATVGVCALSAAIGASVALLAETGPQGPEGQEGAVEEIDLGFLEGEIEKLGRELGDLNATEGRVEDLESDLTEVEEVLGELCFELEAEFC